MSLMSNSGKSDRLDAEGRENRKHMAPDYNLPEWFITRNVKTLADLNDWQATIDISTSESTKNSKEDSKHQVNGDSRPDQNDIAPKHQVPQDKFCELRDITGAAFLRDQKGQLSSSKPSVVLYSGKGSSTDMEFFDAVVMHLARDTKATLVSISLEDLEDLGWEFACQEQQATSGEAKDSGPEDNKPEDNKSEKSKLGDEKPGDDKPGDDKPGDDKPGDDKPEDNKPGDDKPGDDKPGDDKPGDDKPEDNKSEKSKPGDDKPEYKENEPKDEYSSQKSTNNLADYYFAVRSKKNALPKDWNRNRRAISAILDAPKSKGSTYQLGDKPDSLSGINGESSYTTPLLILYIRDPQRIMERFHGHRFLARFKDSVQERRETGESVILLINMFHSRNWAVNSSDDCQCCIGNPRSESRVIRKIHGSEFLRVAIDPPSYSEGILSQNTYIGEVNVRKLKIMLREQYLHLFPKVVLLPFSDWSQGGLSQNLNAIGKSFWSDYELQSATTQIAGRSFAKNQLELEDIQVVLTRMGLHKTDKAIDNINGKAEAVGTVNSVKNELAQRNSETWGEWLDRLKSVCNEDEEALLNCIVNPEELQLSFDDVILDEDTKDTIQYLVSMSSLRVEAASPFLLNQMNTRGLLLYGPPGTGKTHLARATAKASGSNMLAIDPAAITSRWVGETENCIKASFTLAAKLFPCVLFIDEVDALFYRRSSSDRSWERSALTQFLQGMDGLVKSDRAPLVVVATNRPSDLDEAFMRRLPRKIFINLPDISSRAKILELVLKKDNIDDSIKINSLASRTEGYSGSDLHNLCAQAAMIWAIEQRKAKQGETVELLKLRLTNSHFDRALENIRPTVSRQVQRELTEFSRRFGADSEKDVKVKTARQALLSSLKSSREEIQENISSLR